MEVKIFVGDYAHANCYLLLGEKGALVIDPCVPYPAVAAELGGRPLDAILLTHGHFDHILFLEEWREATGAPVYMHKGDGDHLLDPYKSAFATFLGEMRRHRPADGFLEEGDRLEWESPVYVMHTPGHTAGCLCFLVEDGLFTGDTVFAYGGVGRTDLYGGDGRQLQDSLSKIWLLPGGTKLLPGHGESSTVGQEKRLHTGF